MSALASLALGFLAHEYSQPPVGIFPFYRHNTEGSESLSNLPGAHSLLAAQVGFRTRAVGLSQDTEP